jgi:hypothetical protein
MEPQVLRGEILFPSSCFRPDNCKRADRSIRLSRPLGRDYRNPTAPTWLGGALAERYIAGPILMASADQHGRCHPNSSVGRRRKGQAKNYSGAEGQTGLRVYRPRILERRFLSYVRQ